MSSVNFAQSGPTFLPLEYLEEEGAVEKRLQCFLEVEAPPREGAPPLPLKLDPLEEPRPRGGLEEGNGNAGLF